HHDEGVVGDDDARPPSLAHAALNEAFVVMRARRMNALAAPVGEPERAAATEHVGKPAGKIAAADDVAVLGAAEPAREQAERHRVGGTQRQSGDGLFEIEEADVVLPSLAQDDT